MLLEEQGIAHKQSCLLQQVWHCYSGEDDTYCGEPQFVSMDMELGGTVSENIYKKKTA